MIVSEAIIKHENLVLETSDLATSSQVTTDNA